jgi:hypothetical protein
MRNRAEDDGAGRCAQTIDDDGLTRTTKVLIFIDVGSDPAASIFGNPDHRVTRSHMSQQKNRCEQSRHDPHNLPQSKT